MTIPQDLFVAWTAAYGTLHQECIGRQVFVVRPLSRLEVRNALAAGGDATAVTDALLCDAALLWPETWDFFDPDRPAAYVVRLAKAVRAISFMDSTSASARMDYWMHAVKYEQPHRQDLLISRIFPTLTPGQLDRMLPDEYYRHLAMAAFWGSFEFPDGVVDDLLCTGEELDQHITSRAAQQRKELQAQKMAEAAEIAQQQSGARGPYGKR